MDSKRAGKQLSRTNTARTLMSRCSVTDTLEDYKELLKQLKFVGLSVSPYDAKNGNKGKVIDNIVPRTPKSEAVVAKLMLVFDGLDTSKVFIPDAEPDPEGHLEDACLTVEGGP